MNSEIKLKKVCIVGCGAISRIHAKQLRGKVDLYFVSRNMERALTLSKSYGGRGVYRNYEETLESDIDAVVLCTPPDLHAEAVKDALFARKHVLVEKPLCVSREELDSLVSVASTHSELSLVIAENYYYKPSLQFLQDIISDGLIGELEHIHVRKCFRQKSEGWKKEYGALLEGGIHFVALISALTQKSPRKITAKFPSLTLGINERRSQLELDYGNNLSARLEYAWDVDDRMYGLFQHSLIRGSKGHIVFESNGLYVRVKNSHKQFLKFPGFLDLMGYKAQMEDFLACIYRPGRLPKSGISQAQRDLNIVFTAYEQLEELRNE